MHCIPSYCRRDKDDDIRVGVVYSIEVPGAHQQLAQWVHDGHDVKAGCGWVQRRTDPALLCNIVAIHLTFQVGVYLICYVQTFQFLAMVMLTFYKEPSTEINPQYPLETIHPNNYFHFM